MSKLVSLEKRPQIVRHDVSRGIIKSLIAAGFGVSQVTESDVGANFSGLTYRDAATELGRAESAFQHIGDRIMTTGTCKFLEAIGGELPAAGRLRLSCPTDFRKHAIRCHKPHQHGRNQLCWFCNPLSGFAGQYSGVSKITMHSSGEFDSQLHRLIVRDGAKV